MKSLLLGVAVILLIGIGGFVYRNAVEYSNKPITCPLDAKVCPDGTSVARTGNSCTFAACPSPNVTIADVHISYAVPEGFVDAEFTDNDTIAAYELPAATSSSLSLSSASIIIRRFPIQASSTALATIQETAIGGASGLPVPATSFTSTVLGTHRFTVVNIERFEAIVNTAYYLARANDVLRFDAIDRDVLNWTSPSLDVTKLPAATALRHLLSTLQED